MLTYTQAATLLSRGRNGQKKLENNTYLHRIDAETIGVRLHSTDVVKLHADNTYTLDSGGWRTVTTKDRINSYSPARLWQRNGLWYIDGGIFQDEMKINSEGRSLSGKALSLEVEKAKRILDRRVKKYIDGFAAHVVEQKGLTEPSGGDCWGCHFTAEGNDNPMGLDHILSHFEEKYYVPSLLWKAIKDRAGNPAFVWQLIDADAKQGRTDLLKQYLRGYFRTLKPALLEELRKEEAHAS